MDTDEIRRGLIADLCTVAPELDAELLSPSRPLRRQVDLDSMDWLSLVVRWHERFGVDIAEADYARLRTLDDVVAHVSTGLALRARGAG